MKGIRGLCQKTVLIDVGLFGTLIYLIYLLLSSDKFLQSAYNSISLSSSLEIDEVDSEINDNNNKLSLEYQTKLRTLEDVRPAECKGIEYSKTDEKVTLVTYFCDYQLYDLKVSLTTALERENLIGELIVVNDGSTEKRLIDEAKKYLKSLKIPVRLFHNEIRRGTGYILKLAITEAKNDAIVFLDSTVICNRGWLLPLLDQISKVPTSIAVPHFDKITNQFPLHYKAIKETYAAVLQWNLHTVLKRNKDNTDTSSPNLRPDIFAFKKSFLQSIGSVDENFQLGGGEMAELGIRVWACGGSIKIVSCSRVGLVNFDRPFKITSGFNSRHIAGLWFQEKYSHIYTNMRPSDDHLKLIAKRKESVFSSKKCKDIQWYFETILKKNVQVESKTVKIGNLKVESGSCVTVASDMKIDVINCEDMNDIESKPEDVFQLTSDKKLISNGKCLTATATAYIIVEECRSRDNQQSWELTMDSKLINAATRACATHVTDPSTIVPNRQIVMVQSCISEKEEYEKFKKWTFLPV